MSSAFAQTLRSLQLDSYRPAFVLGGVAVPLLVGWLSWATLSTASVVAVTPRGRTEVEGSAVPVDVLDPGRVLVSNLRLGRAVRVGDVLIELDSSLERAHMEELKLRRGAIARRLEPLRKQRDTLLAMTDAQRKVGGAAIGVAAVRAAAAKREAERGREIADISKRLNETGVGSRVDALESALSAERRADLASEGAAEVARAAATQALEAQRVALQDVEFSRALIDAESEMIQVEAQLRTLETLLSRKIVRALVSGYLGDVSPVVVGMTVQPGKPVAIIVPEGHIRMVAYFSPTEAVGRVAAGQRAFLRFEAFPWTQFGIVEGSVVSVGVEPRADDPRNGGVRVEIDIDEKTAGRIPLQHGMPASVEVLVERATPWQMLVRSVGGVGSQRNDAPASGGSPQ